LIKNIVGQSKTQSRPYTAENAEGRGKNCVSEFHFGITENRKFSGSCDVIATARGLFHLLCSLKQT